jgi:hypothetical protein
VRTNTCYVLATRFIFIAPRSRDKTLLLVLSVSYYIAVTDVTVRDGACDTVFSTWSFVPSFSRRRPYRALRRSSPESTTNRKTYFDHRFCFRGTPVAHRPRLSHAFRCESSFVKIQLVRRRTVVRSPRLCSGCSRVPFANTLNKLCPSICIQVY